MSLLILVTIINFPWAGEEILTPSHEEIVFLAGARNPEQDDSYDREEQSSVVSPQYVDFLEVFPQPVRDVLFVSMVYSFGEQVRVEFFDVLGLKIYSEILDAPRTAIDVSGFPRGVYFLSARVGANTHTLKRVIIN